MSIIKTYILFELKNDINSKQNTISLIDAKVLLKVLLIMPTWIVLTSLFKNYSSQAYTIPNQGHGSRDMENQSIP